MIGIGIVRLFFRQYQAVRIIPNPRTPFSTSKEWLMISNILVSSGLSKSAWVKPALSKVDSICNSSQNPDWTASSKNTYPQVISKCVEGKALGTAPLPRPAAYLITCLIYSSDSSSPLRSVQHVCRRWRRWAQHRAMDSVVLDLVKSILPMNDSNEWSAVNLESRKGTLAGNATIWRCWSSSKAFWKQTRKPATDLPSPAVRAWPGQWSLETDMFRGWYIPSSQLRS